MNIIKAFNDGGRFCIVIEDCSPELKNKLIQQLNPTLIGEVEAEPIKSNEKMEKLRNSMELLAQSKKPSKRTDKAFQELSSEINLLPGEYKGFAGDILRNYLGLRFGSIDAKKFMNLKEVQYKAFFDTFRCAIGPGLWGYANISSEQEFYKADIKAKNSFMNEIIKHFANAQKRD